MIDRHSRREFDAWTDADRFELREVTRTDVAQAQAQLAAGQAQLVPIAIELAAFAALPAYLLRQLVSGRSVSATNRMPFGLFPAIWICWVLEVRWLDAF